MKYHILAFGAGFLLDQLFGDPYFLPHPIRGIGWLIAKTEKTLRAGNPQGNPTEREGAERRQGKLLVVIVLLFTGMLSALILFGAYAMHPGLGVVIEAVMTYQILAEDAPRDLPAVCPVRSIVCVPCGNGAHSSRSDADHRPGNVRFYPAA